MYGYARENYFPIHLSQAFVAATLFGEDSISSEFLFGAFQLYISCEEKETLLAALAGKLPLDDEDLLDVLSNYKCYRRITRDNITQTVNELAQKELLQNPKYVIDCFSQSMSLLKIYHNFQSVDNLRELYEMKKPSTRKIIRLFEANPSAEQEHACLDHLKRYVTSLVGSDISVFLAFVTGSNVITCRNIRVSFIDLVGASRRPVVRTCVPLLELPSTYHSYNELAEDALAWRFDIV